ncbi:MAG: hypothetical protein FWH36_07530 [Lentimicrobiaceae bacterium]|nr:hypothetical protein [Lentimicrobiaceae bacterium]
MKKNISIFVLCLVLYSCNNSSRENLELVQESTEIVQENTEIVRENIAFAEKIITDIKGLEDLTIGVPFSVIKEKYSNYVFKEEPDFWGYRFSDSAKTFRLFLTVYSENDGDDTLQGISFSDTCFKLYNDLKGGDPISKIKEKYPNIPIYYNEHDSGEEFKIEDANSIIRIEVDPNNNGELLGEYKKNEDDPWRPFEEKTLKYRTDGKIISINVYRK